jgi:hypothetical protein
MECPFLSTYDEEIECFKECALYNYKGNGGICPFRNISHINSKSYEAEIFSFEKEVGSIKDSYEEKKEQYF